MRFVTHSRLFYFVTMVGCQRLLAAGIVACTPTFFPPRPERRGLPATNPMISITVSLQVVPGHLDDFVEAIRTNAERSFNDEPGCQ